MKILLLVQSQYSVVSVYFLFLFTSIFASVDLLKIYFHKVSRIDVVLYFKRFCNCYSR